MKTWIKFLLIFSLITMVFPGNNPATGKTNFPSEPTPPFKMISSNDIKSSYISKYAPVPWSSGFLFGTGKGELVYMVGENFWMHVSVDQSDIISAPVVVGSSAIIGTKAGTLAKMSLPFGDIVWKYKARNAIVGKPVINDDRIYFGSADESFYCLDLETGEKIFEYKTIAPIWSTPCIISERIIFGGDDDKVHCLNRFTGEILWVFKGDGWFEAEPVVDGGYIIIGSMSGTVFKINSTTGESVWETKTPGAVHSKGVHENGRYVTADDSGAVTAINSNTGEVIWQRDSFAPISAPLSSNRDIVYFIDRNKDFVGLDFDGNQIWKRRLIHSVRSEILIHENKLRMITSDGQLQSWQECGYVEVSPRNRFLGEFDVSNNSVKFEMQITTGREDGRVSPGVISGNPFEAGKRCKSVQVRRKNVSHRNSQRIYDYNVFIDVDDPAFCSGENDFRIFFKTIDPLKKEDGEYEESGLDEMISVRFTFDLAAEEEECQTCSPCYDVNISPTDIPYFKRTETGRFEIEVSTTDEINREIIIEVGDFADTPGKTIQLFQKNGATKHVIEFECMDLPGGSFFSIPIKIMCNSCPAPNKKMMERWHSVKTIEFTTDPRLRIEMKPNSVDVLVNGEPVRLDVPARIKDGRTLVPIRFIAETFGCKVDWEQETKKVTINRNGTILRYWAYKNYAEFNEVRVEIDVGPIIERGRTLVPFRSVAESLGATVRWISSTRDLIIDWEF
jgi:outer membrane protein assembly factor BamB